MKRLLAGAFLAVLLAGAGCSDSDSGSTGTPFGPGGGGGGAVAFTIGSRPGNQGGLIFTARPSAAVTVTQITVALPAQSYQDILQGDGTTVFQAGQTYDLDEYTGVATGQAWVFTFQGRIGNAQGQTYSVTSNFTVP